MKITEILARIEKATGEFEADAVREAIRQRDKITPHLLRILEDTVEQNAELVARGNYRAHLYAIDILTRLRETRAHIPLLRLCLLPPRPLYLLFDDFLDGEIAHALAATCGGDISGIALLIEDPAAHLDVRRAGLGALVELAVSSEVRRSIIVEYFRELFHKLERYPSDLWTELGFRAMDLAAYELRQEMRCAYDEDLLDCDLDWDIIEEFLNGDWEFSRWWLGGKIS